MKFSSHFSSKTLGPEALQEALKTTLKELEGASVDLALLFCSPTYRADFQLMLTQLQEMTSARVLLGCMAYGVIAKDREIEQQTALSLTLASLPDVDLIPFHVTQDRLENFHEKQEIRDFFQVTPEDQPTFLLFPDPYTVDAITLIDQLNQTYPKHNVIGGMASGANAPGESALFYNGQILSEGAIGVALKGNLRVETLVSQGCRPIGDALAITQADRNIIFSLAGKPAMTALVEMLEKCSAREKTLAQQAIFIGLAMNEYVHQFKRGDFVIRNLIGVDQQNGALYVSDLVQVGETIQFHVRDNQSADEDLQGMLQDMKAKLQKRKPAGALLFCCNGRGERLFQMKDHDASAIQKMIGPFPQGGFFCAGEIGPVGGKNFIHGFTSSVALFFPKE